MALMDLAAELVRTLNSHISRIDISDRESMENIEQIKQRMAKIMHTLEKSEDNINLLLSRLESFERESDDVVYVRRNGELKAVVSRSTLKPVIKEIELLEEECSCPFSAFLMPEAFVGCVMIETEIELRELDSSLSKVCLQVFDHDYRSFSGFACVVAVYTPLGQIYIFDAVKFREIIPALRLLKCGVEKVVHCQKCVERLVGDFGSIGCYRNLNIGQDELYIDWRIRPLNSTLVGIICRSLCDVARKLNEGMPLEKYKIVQNDELRDFAEKHSVTDNHQLVSDLIKLRSYLAKKNDESAQFVMTDGQMITLLERLPRNIEEFDSLFVRLSSVLRLHADDFLLILKRKSTDFSIERLKEKSAA